MSIGSSGRIVIEVEPELKHELYAYLARDGITLKQWFLQEARTYLATTNQLSLGLQAPEVAKPHKRMKND